MRATAVVVIVSLLTLAGGNAFAQESTLWRAVAEAIPLGSRVKVSTFEGQRVIGTLMRVDDASILVRRNTRRPEPAMTITFGSITNLERETKGGVSLGKALAVGAATGAGFILTMFVIALQLD